MDGKEDEPDKAGHREGELGPGGSKRGGELGPGGSKRTSGRNRAQVQHFTPGMEEKDKGATKKQRPASGPQNCITPSSDDNATPKFHFWCKIPRVAEFPSVPSSTDTGRTS